MRYEIFISYSRKDNVRIHQDDEDGWVEALRDEIIADHRRNTTDPLEICLYHDLPEIKSLDDWQRNILTGLRESRVLLVCLSPNYFNSPPCLWEWEEYQKRQVHAQVGQDSVAPVYFVEVPGSDKAMNDAWVEAIRRGSFSEDQHGEWKERWQAWRKATMGRPNYVDLKPWFPLGAQALREKTIREQTQTLASARTSLDQQLRNLGTALWSRIERARRAEASPQNPELRRRNRHFIGRHKELGQLHEATHTGAIGLVTVVHGLGGQGKTELVSAYAHEHAYSYPAGRWFLRAEGKRELIPLLADLRDTLDLPRFPDETAIITGFRVLSELKRRSTEAAPRDPDGRPACLLILDNVSESSLLAEPQLDLLPEELWLHVIATTRLAPDSFAASPEKTITFLPLDPLALDDAARLLEEHQPGSQWPAATAKEDANAARELARELGGFALSVESVAIHLGIHRTIRPADYLARLRTAGLPSVDALPADSRIGDRIRHHEKQLSHILDTTLQAANLTALERAVLDYASLLPPDSIPWEWLRSLVSDEFKAALASEPGCPEPWDNTRRRLLGLRLLTSGDTTGDIARMHRMFAAEFRARIEETKFIQVRRSVNSLVGLKAAKMARMASPDSLTDLQTCVEFVLSTDEEWSDSLVARFLCRPLNMWGKAEAGSEMARRSLRRWRQAHEETKDAAIPLINSLLTLGDFQCQIGQFNEATQSYAEGIQVLETEGTRVDEYWNHAFCAALCHQRIALQWVSLDDYEPAEDRARMLTYHLEHAQEFSAATVRLAERADRSEMEIEKAKFEASNLLASLSCTHAEWLLEQKDFDGAVKQCALAIKSMIEPLQCFEEREPHVGIHGGTAHILFRALKAKPDLAETIEVWVSLLLGMCRLQHQAHGDVPAILMSLVFCHRLAETVSSAQGRTDEAATSHSELATYLLRFKEVAGAQKHDAIRKMLGIQA